MLKLISVGMLFLSFSGLAFATADPNQISECVWDKYFTNAEELRIRVDELTKKEGTSQNKASVRKEKDRAAGELKEMREKKRAFDVLKKEKFFNVDEGLKSTFPDEYQACLAD